MTLCSSFHIIVSVKYKIAACLPGYHGENCSSVCPPDTYGHVCENNCNNCSTCHHVYGCDWMFTREGKIYTIQILNQSDLW